MKQMKWLIVLVALVVLVSQIGCASSGMLHVITPMTVKLANYKTMLFHVSSHVREAGEVMIQLENMTMGKLREKGLFKKVIIGSSSPDASADLRLNAKIVALRKVSSGSRAMWGAFSGKARITVDVELIDMKTGETIGAFRAEGKSSGGTAFAGTTPQAIEHAAEQIAGFIQKNQ